MQDESPPASYFSGVIERIGDAHAFMWSSTIADRRRPTMRTIPLVAAMMVAGLSLETFPAVAAAKVYPWCARYSSTAGECSFDTFQQCLDDISGIGGGCTSNPSYSGRRAR
jgi:hypothetical protein